MKRIKLWDIAKMTFGKIRIYDWKDHSKNVYDNFWYIPNELRDRYICSIDSFDGMVEIGLRK